MLTKLRERAHNEKGFTLIELLVVILIIGILAAIALPAFLSQRGKAQDTEAKSGARTAQTAMETWYTDERDYSAKKADLVAIEPALNEGASRSLVVKSGPPQPSAVAATSGYSVSVTSDTGNKFEIEKQSVAEGGNVVRSCSTRAKYGCNKAGSW